MSGIRVGWFRCPSLSSSTVKNDTLTIKQKRAICIETDQRRSEHGSASVVGLFISENGRFYVLKIHQTGRLSRAYFVVQNFPTTAQVEKISKRSVFVGEKSHIGSGVISVDL